MTDMFGDIQKQLKDTQERWTKVDELAEEIEEHLHNAEGNALAETTAKLLLLLVQQLKPINAVDGKEFEKGMKQILDAFTGANNGK